MNYLAIGGFVIGLIGIILIIIITQYNKFQLSIIKLNKGETCINNYLEKKYNILLRYIEILRNNIEINEDDFEEYNFLNLKMPINKLNKKIENMNNAINKYMDNNEKLLKIDTIINIRKELIEINETINGAKKYYNDNLSKHNYLIHKFPSNIIGKMFRYKEKDFLDEEMEEQLKILEEEEEQKQITA